MTSVSADPSAGEQELLDIADRVLNWADSNEQVEVVVSRSHDTEIRAYEGEIEQFSSAAAHGVGIRVIKDHKQGFAYAGALDDDVLAETLAEARDNAVFGTPDEALGLALPDGVDPPALDLWSDELAAFFTDEKVAMAIELERAVRAADPRISGIESCDYADSSAEAAVVTTTGIRSASRETGVFLIAYALAEEAGDTQTGFGYSIGRHPGELDVATAAADAARRATRLLGATKPASGRFTVVLDPWVTAELISIIGSTLSGEAVLKGRSLFAERVGQDVGWTGLTLVDDPTNPSAFTSGEADGEGLASRRNVLVDQGILQGFLHNAYTARRLGTASTGSAVRGGFKSTPTVGCRALSLAPGTKTQAELVASIDNGILVQSVSGLHSGVNPVSGDFSTGAEGLRITGGALAEPIREFTVASTLQRMLKDTVAVGSDLEWLPMSAAGVTTVIDDVTVSGA
jgi:PmbA protein